MFFFSFFLSWDKDWISLKGTQFQSRTRTKIHVLLQKGLEVEIISNQLNSTSNNSCIISLTKFAFPVKKILVTKTKRLGKSVERRSHHRSSLRFESILTHALATPQKPPKGRKWFKTKRSFFQTRFIFFFFLIYSPPYVLDFLQIWPVNLWFFNWFTNYKSNI